MHHRFLSSPLRSATLTLAMAGALIIAGGCSEERSSGSVNGLAATSASVAATKDGIATTNTDLEKLKTAGDIKAAHAAVVTDIAAVKAHAATVKSDYESMKANGDAFTEAWQKEISTVQDPELKKSAVERYSKVKIAFIDITNALGAAKEAYAPYITSLDGIEKVLASDVTPAGVKTVSPSIDKAVASGAIVQTKLDEVSKQLAALTGELAPVLQQKADEKAAEKK